MALTKADKAQIEAAQIEVKELRKLLKMQRASQMLPLIEPDVPIPPAGSGDVTEGWAFNVHSCVVYRLRSSSVTHWSLREDGEPSGCGSQRGRALYSTFALALEAMRRQAVHDLARRFVEYSEARHDRV